jgi:3-hydroxybutyryl-CoA dehydrogenase
MTFTRITTAGAGTMGSQVAWQMAFHGKHVTVYDAIPAGLERARRFIGSTPSISSSARRHPETGR